MIRTLRYLAMVIAALGLVTAGGWAIAQPKDKAQGKGGQHKGQHKHHDGKALLGAKIKQNGKHQLEKQGKVTASVDVQNGKIAGFEAKHDDKGNLPVKKYKTNKKMAELQTGVMPANFILAQAQYLGTTYIGYSYIDDYGDEQIYWYPYDMVLDPDTGAVDYVPAY